MTSDCQRIIRIFLRRAFLPKSTAFDDFFTTLFPKQTRPTQLAVRFCIFLSLHMTGGGDQNQGKASEPWDGMDMS